MAMNDVTVEVIVDWLRSEFRDLSFLMSVCSTYRNITIFKHHDRLRPEDYKRRLAVLQFNLGKMSELETGQWLPDGSLLFGFSFSKDYEFRMDLCDPALIDSLYEWVKGLDD